MKMRNIRFCIFLLLTIWMATQEVSASRRTEDIALIKRMWGYAASIDTTESASPSTYAYQLNHLKTDRRNFILMLVPTMYAISRGKDREFISEAINHVTYYKEGIFSTRPLSATARFRIAGISCRLY